MAFDRQTNPLDIARTVLKPETIREVRSGGYINSAYLILDRWALNSPTGDGFRFVLKGAGEREFQPNNLIYNL